MSREAHVRFCEKLRMKFPRFTRSVMERFFGSLKSEWTDQKVYQTREQAKTDVINYIEMFYNSERLHSTLGYRSPMQFEKMNNFPAN
jgi:putative transposase